MDVREGQRRGLLVLLFMGVVSWTFTLPVFQIPSSDPSRLPWINQNDEGMILEIGGDLGNEGIYFIPQAKRKEAFAHLGVIPGDFDGEGDRMVGLALRGTTVEPFEVAAATRLALGLPIDLNRATMEDLVLVPGIGWRLADQILQLRQRKGKLKDVGELAQLPAMRGRRFDSLRKYLMVEAHRNEGERALPEDAIKAGHGPFRMPSGN